METVDITHSGHGAVHTLWQDTTFSVNHNITDDSFDVKNTTTET